MFRSAKNLFPLRSFGLLMSLVFLTSAMPAFAGSACLPLYSNDTFKKVYRNHKMYLQGVEDINGDGKPDAYGYQLQADNTYKNLVVLLNNGSGGFGEPVVIPGSFVISTKGGLHQDRNYGPVAVGDLNGDGKKDFVVRANTVPEVVYTFRSNPDGSYTQSTPTFIANNEFVVDVADFNGDGRGDVLTMTITEFDSYTLSYNTLSYRTGNTDGTFGTSTQLSDTNVPWMSPIAADFTGDGKADIAFTYLVSNPMRYMLKMFTNAGGGVFTNSLTMDNANTTIAGVADINGDGRIDTWGPVVLLNTGTAEGFSKVGLPVIPAFDYDIRFIYPNGKSLITDYDGDGNLDLVGRTEGREDLFSIHKRFYQVWINDGKGNLTKTNIYRPFLGIPADMDGDGKGDQVIFNNSTQGTPRNTATNETVVIVRQNSCTPPPVQGQTRLIDFGGDGISDISLWSPSTGRWSLRSNLDEFAFNWGGSAFGDIPIPGDYDGDGRTDAAVFRKPTGDWWIRRSSDGAAQYMHWGLMGDIPIPGDYNGDGKTDIAVFRPSDGNWYITFSGSGEHRFIHFGMIGDIPIPGDFDGDGSLDITVFRPSEGNWYYLKSFNGEFAARHWGLAGDIPIPGDYDNDGKGDIAVFRPSTNYWYILRSFDGNADFIQFGLGGDSPMLVDTDGDGVLELGSYRPDPTTGFWYAGKQDRFLWGMYGASNERPLRLMLPNE